jgi:hypothetical protein
MEGLDGLRAQLVEDFSDFHAAITMGIWPSSSRDQLAATPVAPPPQFGIVIVGIAQHIAHLPWPLLHQQGRHRVVTLMERQP